jgi:hypothetical protein
MANALLSLGNDVRIAYPESKGARKRLILSLFQLFHRIRYTSENTGWLYLFRGEVSSFRSIRNLSFSDHEVVIAVGTQTISYVNELGSDVVKIRYNHGILSDMTKRELALWRLNMPTITVANTLCSDLEHLTGAKPIAVVPNGIDGSEYFCLPGVHRDGLGTIFSRHPAKAPDEVIFILRSCVKLWPNVPQYVFSTERAPRSLSHALYKRFPSVSDSLLFFNRSNIWFVASKNEGFSLPILEAMACGCAVISYDTYGARELIRDGENGILVPTGDRNEFLKRAGILIQNPHYRDDLSKAGIATARSFSWEVAAKRMQDCLIEL